MTYTSILALLGTMLVLAVAPGPSDFAVVARSIAAGFSQGLLMVGGIVVADFLFIILAVYSLSEVAETLGGLFTGVKYACAVYLMWLGVGAWRARPPAVTPSPRRELSGYSSFLAGLLITLGDPKAILFYMGLFPAFVDLANISVTDTVTIMGIATLVVGGVKISYAYLANRASRFFENPGIRRKLDLAAGCVLGGAGLFLLLGG